MSPHRYARRHHRKRLQLESLEPRETPAAAGALDPTFGTGGVIDTAPFGLAQVAGLVVEADGQIVAAGRGATGAGVVIRLNADGSPDPTFGTNGVVHIRSEISAVMAMPDGRIVTGGPAEVARLTSSGQLDPSFDGDGYASVPIVPNPPSLLPGGFALDSSGRVLGVGSMASSQGVVAQIFRLTADGVPDAAFGTNGVEIVERNTLFGDQTDGNAVAAQPDEKVLVIGTVTAGQGRGQGLKGAFAVRLNEDGSIDTNLVPGDGRNLTLGNAIAVMPDGRIIPAGGYLAIQQPGGSSPSDFKVSRDLPDGTLDLTFGGGGSSTIDLGGNDEVRSLAVVPDGTIYLVGASTGDFPVIRVAADGTPDAAFNDTLDASIFSRFGGGYTANGVGLQGDRVVVGGSGPNSGFIVRLLGEPRPDLTRPLAISGSGDGTAQLFQPDPAGQYPASPTATLQPFGTIGASVRSTIGDVDGDGTDDTIVVTGPGVPLRFAVVSGDDNSTLLIAATAPFAGSEDFSGGGFVSAADFDDDGRAEVVITPDLGGGPRVTVFSLNPDGTLAVRGNFFGIDDSNFRGGARTGAGDVDGDGIPDLAVAAGTDGGPRVALFDGTSLFTTPARLIGDFFAFEESLRSGAFVAIGDLDADGFGDLIFGAGPGGAPRLLAISGSSLLSNGTEEAIASPLASFFVAGNAVDRGGVRVAAKDADGDSRADIAVGSGEGAPARVRIYLGQNFSGTGEPSVFQDLDLFGGAAIAGGVFVG